MAVHRRHVEVTSPCPIELDPSRGSKGEKGWYCGHCEKNVHVLSNLTEREARDLLADKVGEDLCVTYAVRNDGSIRFRPEPEPALVPVGALSRKRMAAVAAVGLSAALAACTPHQNPEVGPRMDEESSQVWVDSTTIPEQKVPSPPVVPDEPLELVDGGIRPMPVPPPKPGGLRVAPIPEPVPMARGGLSAKTLPDEPCDGPERSG